MKIWFDTEFIEDGRTIELISTGMVREDGAEYYAEFAECDHGRASQWVRDNVLPHLTGPVKLRAEIKRDVRYFAGGKPEFWADYAAYDWVALCQLFGTMMVLPSGWPMFCRDIQQLVQASGGLPPGYVEAPGNHNALADAREARRLYREIEAAEAAGRGEGRDG